MTSALPISLSLGEETDYRIGSVGRKKDGRWVKAGFQKAKPQEDKGSYFSPLLCFPWELTLRLKVQYEERSEQDDLGSTAETP